MMQDVLTVAWKELKSLLVFQGSKRNIILTLATPVVMIGVVLPIQAGRDFVQDPVILVIAAGVVPLLLVGMKVPDAIAGERERKTLETLLASRLPDEAILYGKVATAVAFGWGTTILVLLLSLVVVNAAHWNERYIVFSPAVAVAVLAFALLVALFVAGLGVIISRHAETSQRATQTLLFALLGLPMLLQVGLMFVLGSGDGGRAVIQRVLGTISTRSFAWSAMGVLAIVDAGLLLLARSRFARSRLLEG